MPPNYFIFVFFHYFRFRFMHILSFIICTKPRCGGLPTAAYSLSLVLARKLGATRIAGYLIRRRFVETFFCWILRRSRSFLVCFLFSAFSASANRRRLRTPTVFLSFQRRSLVANENSAQMKVNRGLFNLRTSRPITERGGVSLTAVT